MQVRAPNGLRYRSEYHPWKAESVEGEPRITPRCMIVGCVHALHLPPARDLEIIPAGILPALAGNEINKSAPFRIDQRSHIAKICPDRKEDCRERQVFVRNAEEGLADRLAGLVATFSH